MKSLEIRKKFFDFFIANKHTQVPSSSLIPAQDPTLLFANAGMNQFKDVFLGKEKRSYTRAVSIQKCVRAGGKHNDLDNVGFTKRHLTFFEMMGNFSFGDYFKKEAIQFAWDFLTQEVKLNVEHLHATVFTTDDESYDLWHKMIGLPKNKIHRLGAKENFWQMGDTGPCGPCTELHIDRGLDANCKDAANCNPACDCDRFLEIWNLVFMQFDRQPSGSDFPLKQTGVDTGMGLERLCSVIQNVDSVYETDLFAGILSKIEQLTGRNYAAADAQTKAAFNVLADHIRSSSLLISDGAAPSNDGRGYVLRKIIRRAALFTQKLADNNIFPELSKQVVNDLGPIYPELVTNKDLIFSVLSSEIEKFSVNLVRGQSFLNKYFTQVTSKVVTGQEAFKLYDTYGFPLELIHVMANEKGFTVDEDGFNTFMKQQQEQSGKKTTDELAHLDLGITTEFTGYKELTTSGKVAGLVFDTQSVKQLDAGLTGWIITDKSPFFIVGGGQVPDNGWIEIAGSKTPILSVRFIGTTIAAHIKAPTSIKLGDSVTSSVNKELRINAMKNHTATHLLQSALISILGKTIKQSGSLVHPDYLRFDFTYHENLSEQDVQKVENLVNEKIRENIPVNVINTSLKEATSQGALAFFGDKYNPEHVRMIKVSDFSVELCGGTHVPATGDIGTFKITEVTALAAGHRRIVAVTGPRATELFQDVFNTVKHLSTEFKVKRTNVESVIAKQKEHIKELTSHIRTLKDQVSQAQIPVLLQKVQLINNIPFLYVDLHETDTQDMRDIAQQLTDKHPGLYVITGTSDDKGILFAQLASAFVKGLDLKRFGAWLNETYGIRGGGSITQLHGGASKFDARLAEHIKKWLHENTTK